MTIYEIYKHLRKSMKMEVRGMSGSFRGLGAKMAPKSPKMSEDGGQECQDGAQEAATCSQDGDLGSILEAFGMDFGGFWDRFWMHF